MPYQYLHTSQATGAGDRACVGTLGGRTWFGRRSAGRPASSRGHRCQAARQAGDELGRVFGSLPGCANGGSSSACVRVHRQDPLQGRREREGGRLAVHDRPAAVRTGAGQRQGGGRPRQRAGGTGGDGSGARTTARPIGRSDGARFRSTRREPVGGARGPAGGAGGDQERRTQSGMDEGHGADRWTYFRSQSGRRQSRQRRIGLDHASGNHRQRRPHPLPVRGLGGRLPALHAIGRERAACLLAHYGQSRAHQVVGRNRRSRTWGTWTSWTTCSTPGLGRCAGARWSKTRPG